MSREEAIKELENKPFHSEIIKEEINFIINKLDITEKEFLECFKLPKKTFRDYKSQSGLYEIGSKIMRFLGFERGGKR